MPQAGENHQKVSTNTKSVSKTLAILSSFNERTPTQRTSDIAAKLHMNISTVSRHLNTMLDWGFLMRDEETGRYSLGYEVVALPARHCKITRSIAMPIRSCSRCPINMTSTAT